MDLAEDNRMQFVDTAGYIKKGRLVHPLREPGTTSAFLLFATESS
jgi:hypothetical protein